MGRTQRALTSLVAAIPAGFLSYLLVMVFLNQADSLKTTMQAVVGATLLVSAIVALMPFALLIPGKKKKEPAESSESVAEVLDDDDAVDVMEEDAEVSEDVEVDQDAPSSSDYELDDSDADVMSDSSGEIDAGNDSSLDDIDAFDMDDEEEEEPKTKKKK